MQDHVEASVSICRPTYTTSEFNVAFDISDEPDPSCTAQLQTYCKSKAKCSGPCVGHWLLGFFPILTTLKEYKWKKWLFYDVIAGLSVGVIHIPQGMGFSLLTELPPVNGLYSSIFPVWVYAIFGTSRHISVGTMALISLMMGTVVQKQVDIRNGQQTYQTTTMATTSMTTDNATEVSDIDHELIRFKNDIVLSVTLMVGLFQLVMYVCRLGVIVTYMSMTFVSSFMTGAAIHIITSQIPIVFGISLTRDAGLYSVPRTYYNLFKNITKTNLGALVMSVCCMTILLFFKEFINVRFKRQLKVPIPIELFVIIISTILSQFLSFKEHFSIPVIGAIPTGIPAPIVPSFYNYTDYIVDAIVIAIVAFAISITMAKMMSRKHLYPVDVQQEILAYGLHNALGAFFHSFAGCQAPPRTLVHESTGGKSQLANVISTLLPLLVVLVFGPLFKSLPNCVLAAIIIVALVPLLKSFAELPNFWRINKIDLLGWLVTLLSVVLLSIALGLAIGLGCNIFLVVVQSQFAKGTIMSSPQNIDIYVQDSKRKPSQQTNEPQDVKVFLWDCDLYFSNVERFKTQIIASITMGDTTQAPTDSEDISISTIECKTKIEVNFQSSLNGIISKETSSIEIPEKPKAKVITTVVLDCSSISYIDIMGINTLKEVHTDFKRANIQFVLAACKHGTLNKLRAAGVLDKAKNKDEISLITYPSILDAVVANTKLQTMIAIL